MFNTTKCVQLFRAGFPANRLRAIASISTHTGSSCCSSEQTKRELMNFNCSEQLKREDALSNGISHKFRQLNLSGQSPLAQFELHLSLMQRISNEDRSKIELPVRGKTPILDQIRNNELSIGDRSPHLVDIVETPARSTPMDDSVVGDTGTVVKKEGRMIQKIRRWKMNRHQLKKLRKRMLFHNRKMRLRKEKKKEKILQEQLDGIRREAEEFDARKFVLEELSTARRGGFKIDVWATWQTQKQSQ